MTATLMKTSPQSPTTDSKSPTIEGWLVAAISGCGLTE
jgi:hypothetical protein